MMKENFKMVDIGMIGTYVCIYIYIYGPLMKAVHAHAVFKCIIIITNKIKFRDVMYMF